MPGLIDGNVGGDVPFQCDNEVAQRMWLGAKIFIHYSLLCSALAYAVHESS